MNDCRIGVAGAQIQSNEKGKHRSEAEDLARRTEPNASEQGAYGAPTGADGGAADGRRSMRSTSTI